MADFSSWTAPAESAQYGVYLGTWVNWSRGGRVLGATLTLESRYGLLILSFTATFVGFVASRFWRIITLILHRIYSTPEPRDALHHQRQVVLRNSVSAVSTLYTSLQLAWCWRAVADGCLARTLPTIIFAASAFCAFTVAGGFTSSISSGIGNDVLIDGSQCGLVAHMTDMDMLSVIYPGLHHLCQEPPPVQLQMSVLNASCPFGDGMCRSSNSNVLLDSGLISSDDFGLNLPRSQRMYYREVLQCAPLRTEGFVSNASTGYNNFTRYWYGGARGFNWTYEVESLDAKYRRQAEVSIPRNAKGFNLIGQYSSIENGTVWLGNSDFVPIPQLTLPDADLLVAFLSPEGVLFLNETDDPWYRGTVPRAPWRARGGQHDVYMPEESASPMGCAQRYQYCNSAKQCGGLASFSDALISAVSLFHGDPGLLWSGAEPSGPPDATRSRFELFQATIVYSASLTDMLNTLGASSLLSSQHMVQNFMGPLPSTQWQLDVSHWFSMRMAAMQASFLNTAHGPGDEAVLPYVNRPDDEHQRAMCKNQKILSTDYTSLSLFGLYFTYATGIAVILASYLAEPLLALPHSRRRHGEYTHLEWAANSTLQLQRLAYQGLGSEKWSNYTDDIPKTRPGYFLADLARAYPPRDDGGDDDDDDKVQEVKPSPPHGTGTPAAPSSVSSEPGGADGRAPGHARAGTPRPVSAASQPAPQAVSPVSQAPGA